MEEIKQKSDTLDKSSDGFEAIGENDLKLKEWDAKADSTNDNQVESGSTSGVSSSSTNLRQNRKSALTQI